jgi:L-iditol 2-dehydrogenase
MSAPIEGAFTEYSVRPAHFCFKLPDNVSYDEGAMCEPLAVALQSLKQGQIIGGKSVAIMGCGPIALTILLACKAYGCTDIYMTDVVDYRLKKAEELGATKAINSAKTNPVEEIKKLTNGCGVDVVFDATGLDVVYRMVTDIVARGGFIVLVGMGAKEYSEINIAAIRDNENSLVGVFRYDNVYKQAVDLVGKGLIDMTQIISHHVGLDDIVEALEMVHDKKDDAIKIVINM